MWHQMPAALNTHAVHLTLEKGHLSGECGREHDRLAVWADVVDDAVDLWLKAHVKHAICLVQHLHIPIGKGDSYC
jgi:hypothetical protein